VHTGTYAAYGALKADWLIPNAPGHGWRSNADRQPAVTRNAVSDGAEPTAYARARPVVVTGANGGVAPVVAIRCAGSSAMKGHRLDRNAPRKPTFLKSLGASEVIQRDDSWPGQTTAKERWPCG